MRRMVLLARASRESGNPKFNTGMLIAEVSAKKDLEQASHPMTISWIELIISQLDLEVLIPHELTKRIN